MHTKVAVVTALDRVLDGLAEELLAASEEELIAAARDLGMDPTMRGSAAFLGLKYAIPTRPAHFFAEFGEWFEQRRRERLGRASNPPIEVTAEPVPEAETPPKQRKAAARRRGQPKKKRPKPR